MGNGDVYDAVRRDPQAIDGHPLHRRPYGRGAERPVQVATGHRQRPGRSIDDTARQIGIVGNHQQIIGSVDGDSPLCARSDRHARSTVEDP